MNPAVCVGDSYDHDFAGPSWYLFVNNKMLLKIVSTDGRIILS